MPQEIEDKNEEPIVIPDLVTKEEYEKLGKIEKRLLRFDEEEGVYVPNIGNIERRDSMLVAKQQETAEANKIREENKKLQNKINMFEANKNIELKKIEQEKKTAFEKYQERLDKLEHDSLERENRIKQRLEKSSIDKGVTEIAEFFLDSHKKVAKDFIKNRLSVEYVNDEPIYVFTDDFGNKINKLSEIKKNLFADQELKDKLKGTDNGGSNFGSHNRSQVVPVISDIKTARPEDLVALANSDQEAFLALIKSQNNQ